MNVTKKNFPVSKNRFRKKINNFIIVLSSFLFILSLVMCKKSYSKSKINQHNSHQQNTPSTIYKPNVIKWDKDYVNPKHQKKTDANNSQSLYIMIIDSEFKPKHFQCLMKKQWVDELLKQDFVDGAEYFSRIHWENEECGISTIVTPPSIYKTLNPTSWILLNSLKMFLERSDSAYLFLVGDATYIKVPEFINFFKEFSKFKSPREYLYSSGSCIELRYFFQMFLIGSGILLSRKLVTNLVEEEAMQTWMVACEVGINSDESLSQICDQFGMYPQNNANNQFVGQEFRYKTDYNIILSKNFDNLPKCEIPKEYINNIPGTPGVCSKEIIKFKDVISWSGAGRNATKLFFLENAKLMLENLPDFLGYYWSQSHPRLCRLR